MAINAGQVFVDLGARMHRREFDAYDRELQKVREKVARKERYKAQLAGDFDSRAFRAYERQLAQAERQTHGLSRATGTLGGSFKRLAGGAGIGAGVAGLASLGLAFKKIGQSTVDFDRSMRNVNSIAQLSEKNLGALSQSVLKLAGKTAQAPKTLADGLYQLVSSGFDAKESLLILESSAKAATAGLTDTETSTTAVAAVLNAYHRPAKDAAEISDALFKTVDKGVISFENLAQNIGDTLPFASSLGVSVNEVGAATATMTKQGLSAEETMTRIRNVFVTMLKPGDALKGAFKDLGVESGEALIKQKGFQGALEAIVGTTDGTKKAMAALFPNIRSLGGALSLTGKNTKSAEKDLKAFASVGGSTDKALSQQARSISFQWNKAKANLTAASIELGAKLGPSAVRAARGLTTFVNQMQNGEGAGGKFVNLLQALARGFTLFARGVRSTTNVIAGFFSGLFRALQALGEAGSHLPGVGDKFKSFARDAKTAADKIDDFRKKLRISVEAGKVNDDLESMRKKTGSSIGDIRKTVRDGMRVIRNRLGTDTDEGQKAVHRHFRSMVARIREAMRDGKIETSDGLGEIRKIMLAELKELGIPVAQAKGKPLSPTPPKGGNVPVVKAGGGWIGAPGTVGYDTIPAMLAPGEAVLNRHQQGVIESMLGDGFLDRLFAQVNRPHFMQQGGRVRFARGGTDSGRFLQLPENIHVTHQTAGLAGYPAQDIFASPGTSVGAPVSGVIARLSGQAGGPGGGGAYGYSIYENGSNNRSYFLTHFGSTSVRPGQHVRRGQTIGTVADYPGGIPDHIHEGVHGGLTGITRGGPRGTAAVQRAWKAIKSPRAAMGGLLGDVVQGTLDRTTRLANQRGRALAQQASGPGAGAGPAPRGSYGFGALEDLWRGVGGRSAAAAIMAHIALAESGGNPRARNPSGASGLWQILGLPFPGDPFDPATNARMAIAKSSNGQNLHPWDASRAAWGKFAARGGRFARGGKTGTGKERAWLNRSWAQVAPLFGLPADSKLGSLFKHIRLSKESAFVGVSSDPGAKGHETDDLLWPRWLWQSSKGQKALDNKSKLQLFIHEMAHRFQSHGATPSVWESEGGAEAFARIAMDRRFGGRRSNRGDPYNAYVTRVVKRHGMDWIARTQFGHALGGLVLGFQRGGKARPAAKKKPVKPTLSAKENRGITRSVARGEKGIVTFESDIQQMEREYGQMDRRFGITDEVLLVEQPDGSVTVDQNALADRLDELDKLIKKRKQIEDKIRAYRRAVGRLIKSIREAVHRLTKALHAAKGKARAKERGGYRTAINSYEERLGELRPIHQTLGGDIEDARIDLLELRNERREVAGTIGTPAPPGDTGAADTGTDAGTTAEPETRPPSPLEVAEAAATEMRTFLAGRQELLTSFGRNFVPAPQGAAYFASPDPLTAAAGVRAFGAGGTGGGLGGSTIINNYNQLPSNVQTWNEQMRFMVGG